MAYGTKYAFQIDSLDGQHTYDVRLKRKDYVGSIDATYELIDLDADWGGSSKNPFDAGFLASSVRLIVRDVAGVIAADVFGDADDDWLMEVDRDSADFWHGFVRTDLYVQPIGDLQNVFEIIALDGTEHAKGYDYPTNSGRAPVVDTVVDGIGVVGDNLGITDFRFGVDWYPYREGSEITGDPLKTVEIDREWTYEDHEIDTPKAYDSWTVLDQLARRFQSRVMQSGGAFRLVNTGAYRSTYTEYEYNDSAVLQGSASVAPVTAVAVGTVATANQIELTDQSQYTGELAYRTASTQYDHGSPTGAFLANGDFETDGGAADLTGWTASGAGSQSVAVGFNSEYSLGFDPVQDDTGDPADQPHIYRENNAGRIIAGTAMRIRGWFRAYKSSASGELGQTRPRAMFWSVRGVEEDGNTWYWDSENAAWSDTDTPVKNRLAAPITAWQSIDRTLGVTPVAMNVYLRLWQGTDDAQGTSGYEVDYFLWDEFTIDILTGGVEAVESTTTRLRNSAAGVTQEWEAKPLIFGDGPSGLHKSSLTVDDAGTDVITGGWKIGAYATAQASTEVDLETFYLTEFLKRRRKPTRTLEATLDLRGTADYLPHQPLTYDGTTYAPVEVKIDLLRRKVSGIWVEVLADASVTVVEDETLNESAIRKSSLNANTISLGENVDSQDGYVAVTAGTVAIGTSATSISVEPLTVGIAVDTTLVIVPPDGGFEIVKTSAAAAVGDTSISIYSRYFDRLLRYPAGVRIAERDIRSAIVQTQESVSIIVANGPIGTLTGTYSNPITSLSLVGPDYLKVALADDDVIHVVPAAGGAPIEFTVNKADGYAIGAQSITVDSASPSTLPLSGDTLIGDGQVSRAEFEVTSTQITNTIKREGDQIGLLTGGPYSGSISSITVDSLGTDLKDDDQILLSSLSSGIVFVATVNGDHAAGETTIAIDSLSVGTDGLDADDPVTPGAMVSMRMTFSGIDIAAPKMSSNWDGTMDGSGNVTAAGTTGWALTKAGDAVFNDVWVRGKLDVSEVIGDVTFNGGAIKVGTDVEFGASGLDFNLPSSPAATTQVRWMWTLGTPVAGTDVNLGAYYAAPSGAVMEIEADRVTLLDTGYAGNNPGFYFNSNRLIHKGDSIDELTDVDTTTVAPSTNDVLKWDGSNWVPAAGSGSGTDADTLDGLDSTQFLRSDAADTFTQILSGSGNGFIQIERDGAATDNAFRAKLDTFGTYSFAIDVSGKHQWGDGTAAFDTNLYRSATNVLKTDDAFHAASLALSGALTGATTINASGDITTTADIYGDDLTLTGRLVFGASSWVAGSAYTSAAEGLILGGKTGTSYDWVLTNGAGSTAMRNITATRDVEILGSLEVGVTSGSLILNGALTGATTGDFSGGVTMSNLVLDGEDQGISSASYSRLDQINSADAQAWRVWDGTTTFLTADSSANTLTVGAPLTATATATTVALTTTGALLVQSNDYGSIFKTLASTPASNDSRIQFFFRKSDDTQIGRIGTGISDPDGSVVDIVAGAGGTAQFTVGSGFVYLNKDTTITGNAYVGDYGTGDGSSDIYIRSEASSESRLSFYETTTPKWQIGKSAANVLFLYDYSNSATVFQVSGSGDWRQYRNFRPNTDDAIDLGHSDYRWRAVYAVDFNIEGAIDVGDGSAAEPAYTFSADTDTGFFRVTSGAVGYSSNGTHDYTLGGAGFVTLTGNTLGESGNRWGAFYGTTGDLSGALTASALTALTAADGATVTAHSQQNDALHSTTVAFGSFVVYSDDGSGMGAGVRGGLRVYPGAASGGYGESVITASSGTGEEEVARFTTTGTTLAGALTATGAIHTDSYLALDATQRLYFDLASGSHTYIAETSNDLLSVYAGGSQIFNFSSAWARVNNTFYLGSSNVGRITWGTLNSETNSIQFKAENGTSGAYLIGGGNSAQWAGVNQSGHLVGSGTLGTSSQRWSAVYATDFNISGAIDVGDGTAADPSFTFTDDTDTGFFRVTSGAVGYSSNGTHDYTLGGAGFVTLTGNTLGESGNRWGAFYGTTGDFSGAVSTGALTATTGSFSGDVTLSGAGAIYTVIKSGVGGGGANNAGTLYYDNSTVKWLLRKDSSNRFTLYDYSNSTEAFIIGGGGDFDIYRDTTVNANLGVTGILTVTGTFSAASLDADSLTIGGGYGDTGLTVAATGNLSTNGTGTFDGAVSTGALTATTLSLGAGVGATTIDDRYSGATTWSIWNTTNSVRGFIKATTTEFEISRSGGVALTFGTASLTTTSAVSTGALTATTGGFTSTVTLNSAAVLALDNSTDDATIQIYNSGGAADNQLRVLDAGVITALVSSAATQFRSDQFDLLDGTGASYRMRMDSSGNFDFKSGTATFGGAVTMTNNLSAANITATSGNVYVNSTSDAYIYVTSETDFSAYGVSEVKLSHGASGGTDGTWGLRKTSGKKFQLYNYLQSAYTFQADEANRNVTFGGDILASAGTEDIGSVGTPFANIYATDLTISNTFASSTVEATGGLVFANDDDGASDTLMQAWVSYGRGGAEKGVTGFWSATTTDFVVDSTVGDLVLQINGGDTVVGGTMYFGTGKDTNLYRRASGELATDDLFVAPQLQVTSAVTPASGAGVEIQYNGGQGEIYAYDRSAGSWKSTRFRGYRLYFGTNTGTQALEIDTDQKLWIGSTKDTNLYRSAANTLKTDDAFVVGGTLDVTGAVTAANGAFVVATAGTVKQNVTQAGDLATALYEFRQLGSTNNMGVWFVATDSTNTVDTYYSGTGAPSTVNWRLGNTIELTLTSSGLRHHGTFMRVGPNTAGDTYFYWNAGTDWSAGIDNSDSDAWVLSNYSSLGINNKIVVHTGAINEALQIKASTTEINASGAVRIKEAGTVLLEADGGDIDITNNLVVGGTLGVTGAIQGSSTVGGTGFYSTAGTLDSTIVLDKLGTEDFWNYIDFKFGGSRRFYFGINASGDAELGVATATKFNVGTNLTVTGTLGVTGVGTFSDRLVANNPYAAGTYGVQFGGNAGAARDILLVGQSGVSNGFTVQYDGSYMVYTFKDGGVTIDHGVGASLRMIKSNDAPHLEWGKYAGGSIAAIDTNYNAGAEYARMLMGGAYAEVQRWTETGVSVTGTLAVTGVTTLAAVTTAAITMATGGITQSTDTGNALYNLTLRRSGTGSTNPDLYGASGSEGIGIGYDGTGVELYVGNAAVTVTGTLGVTGAATFSNSAKISGMLITAPVGGGPQTTITFSAPDSTVNDQVKFDLSSGSYAFFDVDFDSYGSLIHWTGSLGATAGDLVLDSLIGDVELWRAGNLRLKATSSGVDVAGTLGVTGASTLQALTTTAKATIGGALQVTGAYDGTAGSLGVTGGSGLYVTGVAGTTYDIALATSGGLIGLGVAVTTGQIVVPTTMSVTGAIYGSDINITGNIDVGNGTSIAPSYTFASETNTGFWWDSTNQIGVTTTGTQRFRFGASNLTYVDIDPSTDGTIDLGWASARYGEVHAVTFHGDGSNLTNISAGTMTEFYVTGDSGGSATIDENDYLVLTGTGGITTARSGDTITFNLGSVAASLLTGQVAVANGGLNRTSAPANSILYGGTTTWSALPENGSATIRALHQSNGAPYWGEIAATPTTYPTLTSQTDTDISGVAAYDVLQYNGSDWINSDLSYHAGTGLDWSGNKFVVDLTEVNGALTTGSTFTGNITLASGIDLLSAVNNTSDIGTSSTLFKNAYFNGTVRATTFDGNTIQADGSTLNITYTGTGTHTIWKSSGTGVIDFSYTGDGNFDGTVTDGLSDGRWKTDWKDLDGPKSLRVLSLLKPGTFTYKDRAPGPFGGRRDVGLIAQDVARVWAYPSWYNADKDKWGIHYDKFVPLLIAGVNAVKSETDKLRDKIATLEQRIAVLETV